MKMNTKCSEKGVEKHTRYKTAIEECDKNVDCTMVIDTDCDNKGFMPCNGEPIADPNGTCAWVKGKN